MSLPNFANLRPGNSDCPSELALDRYLAKELDADKTESLRLHITGCPACTERVRGASFAAMPEVDERRMLARIRTGLDRPQGFGERLLAWLQGTSGRYSLIAAASALALVLLIPLARRDDGVAPPPPDEMVRQKGGLGLRVFRLKDGASEEALSGSRFHPGDVVRFVVDLPQEGQVRVVGIEQGGSLYTAWPQQPAETLLPAGKGQQLPGAITLDASKGRETLYLVHCPPASGAPTCRATGEGEAPRCGDGCQLTPFVMDKS